MYKNSEERIKNVIYILPLIFIIVFVPILVYAKPIQDNLMASLMGEDIYYDFFSYYKAILLFIASLIGLIMVVLRRWKEDFIFKKVVFYIPIAFYIICVILSALFSKVSSIAAFGFVDRYEGAYIILTYMVILLITMNSINEKSNIKFVIYSMMISATIISFIAIFQYFGFDLYKSYIGGRLIFPKELYHISDARTFDFSAYKIYASMGNSNYVGSYVAMLFPISLGLYLHESKLKNKILWGVLSCLMFATWIGCRSRAGMVGGLIAIVVIVVLSRKSLKMNYKNIIIIIPYILIFILMNQASGSSLLNKVSTINPLIEESFAEDRSFVLKDIIISDNKATIVGEEQILNIVVKNKEIFYLDDKNNPLETYNDDKNVIRFKDSKYVDFIFDLKQEQEVIILSCKLKNIVMDWFINKDKIFLMDQQGHLYNTIYHPKKLGFEGRERFGSSRGYIWSRTIPMIKNTLIIGNGPDTFAVYFPQYDMVGKLKNFGKTNIIVDKPHNYYLQLAVDTGVPSLIAMLSLFGMYIISSLRLYMKTNSDDFFTRIGILIFAAVCGYLIAAVFNDSVVSVAPVFWVLLGTGLSINHRLKAQMKTGRDVELIVDSVINTEISQDKATI